MRTPPSQCDKSSNHDKTMHGRYRCGGTAATISCLGLSDSPAWTEGSNTYAQKSFSTALLRIGDRNCDMCSPPLWFVCCSNICFFNHISKYQNIFQHFQKYFKFYKKRFQNKWKIQKYFKLSRNILNCPKTNKMFQTYFICSQNVSTCEKQNGFANARLWIAPRQR